MWKVMMGSGIETMGWWVMVNDAVDKFFLIRKGNAENEGYKGQ